MKKDGGGGGAGRKWEDARATTTMTATDGVGRLVTRNVMALPTARGALKGPRAGVFSAKLVMRTLYDTARRAARARAPILDE